MGQRKKIGGHNLTFENIFFFFFDVSILYSLGFSKGWKSFDFLSMVTQGPFGQGHGIT